jgi:putative ABC transport system permease protein
VALGKSLGMTRAQVVSLFASEYALVGLVGGLVGSLAGAALAAVVLREGFEIPWRFEPGLLLATTAGTALLATISGLLASARALAERPIEALRRES